MLLAIALAAGMVVGVGVHRSVHLAKTGAVHAAHAVKTSAKDVKNYELKK